MALGGGVRYCLCSIYLVFFVFLLLSPGLISSILAGKKKIVEHFFYVKETVELVPEHPHRTHRVNPHYIQIERRDDGDVPIAREISDALRAKIAWGLLTP